MTRRLAWGLGAMVATGLVAWGVTRGLERLLDTPAPVDAALVADPAPATAHITATLFFGSEDGHTLTPVQHEVPLARGIVEQGRQILLAQLDQAPLPPLGSVIPAGTTLRAFFLTPEGHAFVDLSPDVSVAHPGGSQAELLTVYALVNAVAANLPAVRRVQILVNGHEVDTLAGHVDLRQPLPRNVSIVTPTEGSGPPPADDLTRGTPRGLPMPSARDAVLN